LVVVGGIGRRSDDSRIGRLLHLQVDTTMADPTRRPGYNRRADALLDSLEPRLQGLGEEDRTLRAVLVGMLRETER
jgi:hypothetical protein